MKRWRSGAPLHKVFADTRCIHIEFDDDRGFFGAFMYDFFFLNYTYASANIRTDAGWLRLCRR